MPYFLANFEKLGFSSIAFIMPNCILKPSSIAIPPKVKIATMYIFVHFNFIIYKGLKCLWRSQKVGEISSVYQLTEERIDRIKDNNLKKNSFAKNTFAFDMDIEDFLNIQKPDWWVKMNYNKVFIGLSDNNIFA